MNRRDFGALSLGMLATTWAGKNVLAQEGPLTRKRERRYE